MNYIVLFVICIMLASCTGVAALPPASTQNVEAGVVDAPEQLPQENDTPVSAGIVTEPTTEAAPQSVPADWQTYIDQAYGYSIAHPADWAVTPTPTEGSGGVARLEGLNGDETLFIDIGQHFVERETGESLAEFEVRRNQGGEPALVLEETNLTLGGKEILRQTIELTTGGGSNAKRYGIYYLIPNGGVVLFLEGYTSNVEANLDFFDQMVASMQF